MDIKRIFENYAADFERSVEDDNWSRLDKYFAEDATYINVGFPESECIGRNAILSFLKEDVTKFDRRFDSRTLLALTPPVVQVDRLSRKWRISYTLAGAKDLVIEGEARYLFETGLIKSVAEELTPESMRILVQWMHEYGEKLSA